MSNILKDLAILFFSAGEEVEKKANEFKEKREERYKEFEEKMKDKKEEFKSKFGEEINKAKENLSEIIGKVGLASKKEIDDLKDMINELNSKIDKMNK